MLALVSFNDLFPNFTLVNSPEGHMHANPWMGSGMFDALTQTSGMGEELDAR